MRKPLLFIIALLVIQLPSYAQTQADLNEKAWGDYSKADAKLNKVYQAVLKKYRNDPLTTSKIRTAEQAWLEYRDAEIEAIFPVKSTFKEQLPYGSVFPMCKAEELQVLTESRIKVLEMWLKMEEGNVCAGSRWP